MAKILYGDGVANMSGKQGGSVYSKNANGAYKRANRKGVNPNTPSQQTQRAKFSQGAKYYASLSPAQKQSYKDGAFGYPYRDRVGNTSYYTGAQLAAKYANIYAVCNAGATPAPASLLAPIFLDSVNTMVATKTVAGGVLTLLKLTGDFLVLGGTANGTVDSGQAAVISATSGISAGVTAPKKSLFKTIGVFDSGQDFSAGINVLGEYAAIFSNSAPVGSVIWFNVRIYSLSTPQKSSDYYVNIVI
jgi:hypothetical protein